MITLGKKYQTQSGLPVRILCIDGPGSLPVIGLINEETISYWESDGTWLREHQNTFQLVPAPTKREGWMVFDTSSYALYATKESAQKALRQDIGCQVSDVVARVTWED